MGQLGGLKGGDRVIQHQCCDRLGRWKPGRVEGHGRVRLRVGLCEEAYRTVGVVAPRSHRSTTVSALADTGAQMCVMGQEVLTRMGLRVLDLLSAAMKINVANDGSRGKRGRQNGMAIRRVWEGKTCQSRGILHPV